MAHIIKYIGDCITKNTNIEPLYINDLNSGVKVFLVCEKEYETLIDIKKLDKFFNIVEAKNAKGDISILFSENPKIDCIYLAVQFNQVECEFYTEYNGIFSANPKKYQFAKKLDKIDYDELLIISDLGYNLVSGEVLEVAKRYGIAIRVISYNVKDENDRAGSVIKEAIGSEEKPVKSIVKSPNYCIITIFNVPDEKGISYKIFKEISDAKIVVDSIIAPVSKLGKQDLSFTVLRKDKSEIMNILKNKKDEFKFDDFKIKDNIVKISLIGSALQSSFGVGTAVFKVLYENDINLEMINSGEIKVSVFINKDKSDLALEKLHEVFI